MAILDVRRHAEAAREGSAAGALSREGLSLALRLAPTAPAYSLVVVSPRPRTQETAKAIAGRFDEIERRVDVASDDVITIDEYFSLLTPDALAALVSGRAAAKAFVTLQLQVWAELASRLGERQTGLIVAHGANVELPAVALALRVGAQPRGVPVGYLEGVRVTYEGLEPRAIEPLNAV